LIIFCASGVHVLGHEPVPTNYPTPGRDSQIVDALSNVLPDGFDEATYLWLNPDVAAAVAGGHLPSG
jgi:hypothetical protein